MSAPSLVSYNETTSWIITVSNSGTIGQSVTPGSGWQAGDLIVVVGADEGANNSGTFGLPTATGLSFSALVNNVCAGDCTILIAVATAGSNGSGAIKLTYSNDEKWGFGVYVIRNHNGQGNLSSSIGLSSRTANLTVAQIDSLVIWIVADFAAAAVQTITPTPTNTRQNTLAGGGYTVYLADITDQSNTGSIAYGIGGSGVGPFTIGVLEVKGIAASSEATVGLNYNLVIQ